MALESPEDLLAEIERLTDETSFYSLNLWERSPETQAQVDEQAARAKAAGRKTATDGKRLRADWVGSQGVLIDLDTDQHDALPDNARQFLTDAIQNGAWNATAGYVSFAGIHLVYIYDRTCYDVQTHLAAVEVFRQEAQQVADVLHRLHAMPQLLVDPKPLALSGLLYAPQATDPKGRKRNFRFTIPTDTPTLFDPTQYQPLEDEPEQPKPAPKPNGRIHDAASAWNGEHPVDFPEAHRGLCPVCASPDGFGPGSKAGEWVCWSSRHDEFPVGQKAGDHFFGDALDLEAHTRKTTRTDVLRQDGYYVARQEVEPPAFDEVPLDVLEAQAHLHEGNGHETPEEPPDIGLEGNETTMPVIEVSPDLRKTISLALDALADHGGVYRRGGSIVTIRKEAQSKKNGTEDGINRALDAPVIRALKPPGIQNVLAECSIWTTWDGRLKKIKRTQPPRTIGANLAEADLSRLPVLSGILTSPSIRPDGTILNRPGYDPETGFYLDPLGERFPDVPDSPTRGDAKRAYSILAQVFEDFTLEDRDKDLPVLIALILSILGRPAIAGPVPFFVVMASTPGTGKTLSVEVAVLISTGMEPAANSPGATAEETDKRLTAIALGGDAVVLFDNLEGSIGNTALARAATATVWGGRKLGESEELLLPWETVLAFTGNNLTLKGDLHRRVLTCVHYTETERPEDREGPELASTPRKWRHDPIKGWIRSERPGLVQAALTLLRAHAVAGRPVHDGPKMGSFEAWDRTVRSAMIWAAEADPCATQKRVREEQDDDRREAVDLLTALEDVFGDGVWTTKEAVSVSTGDPDNVLDPYKDVGRAKREALRDALEPFVLSKKANTRTGGFDATTVGYILRGLADRTFGGMRVGASKHKAARSARLWRITKQP